jgi:predicted transcriptional regulator
MATLSLQLDDTLNAELEKCCADRGKDKVAILTKLIQDYVAIERLHQRMSHPAVWEEYRKLEAEGALDVDPNEYADLLAELNEVKRS